MLPFYGVFVDDARPDCALFVVEVDFFAITVLFVLPVLVAFVALARFVAVLVFFAAVEVRRLAGVVRVECAPSPVGVAFLRVPRRAVAPFSRGFASSLRCTAMTSW